MYPFSMKPTLDSLAPSPEVVAGNLQRSLARLLCRHQNGPCRSALILAGQMTKGVAKALFIAAAGNPPESRANLRKLPSGKPGSQVPQYSDEQYRRVGRAVEFLDHLHILDKQKGSL